MLSIRFLMMVFNFHRVNQWFYGLKAVDFLNLVWSKRKRTAIGKRADNGFKK